MKEVLLTVAGAKQRDIDKGIARISEKMMKTLGIKVGEIIEIEGKRKSAAKAWPAYPEDEEEDIIRLDGTIRMNVGVSIGEKVVVRKANVKPAIQVKLAPSSFTINVDQTFIEFVKKKKLLGYPVCDGDFVNIPVLGQAITFVVVSTKPNGIVVVVEETNLQILEKPTEVSKFPRVTYEDIGGLHDAVEKIREMVELPLKHPELFKRLGIDPPKGVLLYGPPGCGKTLLAKAVANETDAYFIAINGPEIMGKYYGESEQRLRTVFEDAKQHAPAIIFIDEIDAIAPKREEVTGEVEKRVVAQLLALMDGLETRGQIIVIGATNIPNVLDPALRRPGRFDREVEIGVPDKQSRFEILQIHTRNMPLAIDVDLKTLAEITHGYVGADLAALCREAAMKSLRRLLPEINLQQEKIEPEVLEKLEVTMRDFLEAYREITPTAMREVYVEVPSVKWDDVGGLNEIKQELKEAIEWPIRRPDIFEKMGISPPKGVLLYGPPGCGKTLLAKAVANESGANFISIKGPEIFSKWVGESEKAIREIFRKARIAAPCVVFFDEIESITPVRGLEGGSNIYERVTAQLLVEIDGISKLEGVVVLGATNRPDILDPALLRPGRFDRLIFVPPPNVNERLQIFRIHTAKMPISNDVNLEHIAKITEGYSGADIEAVCREAAFMALRENMNTPKVNMKHFEIALKKIKPTLTEDILRFYKMWEERLRKSTFIQSRTTYI
ncbi:MAG: CDC48 family AAA ATPase [Candidatus Methanomethylicia archaeon]